MKRGIIISLGLLVLLLWIPLASADGTWSIGLVAGQHDTIGTVEISIVGDTLTATYLVTSPGWCLTTTHFYADNVAPERSAPGQFPYKHEGLDCATSDTFVVPTPEGDVFVAAHADSHFEPGTYVIGDEPADPLSGSATLVAAFGGDSYLTVTVEGGVNGTFNAWCIDMDSLIFLDNTYTADVYESGVAPDFITEVPENLDLVNYIINQDYSDIGASVMDIQWAIWQLIETEDFSATLSDASQQIVADALANGEGFVPGCGQVMGIVLDPQPDAQHLILEYPAPCPQTVEVGGSAHSETAWSVDDWGIRWHTGWGMYFQLVAASDEPPPPPPPDEPPPPPPPDEPPPSDHGNRARRDEAPGQNNANDAPGSRRDEAPGQQGHAENQNHGHSNNGHGHGGG